MHDVLIIGGGPAGIGVAYHLRHEHLDLKVLEASSEVGGRTKSMSMPGGMANTAAHFVYRCTPSEELVSELGLAAIPFEPSTYGISLDGVTSVGDSNATVVDGLPLEDHERAALLAVLDEAVEEYRASTSHGAFTERAEALGDESVADRLRQLPPRVSEIIETAVRGGSVGDPDKLLARYALRYFASYPAHETENRLLLVEGQQAIPNAMAATLADGTIDLGTRATGVHHDPEQDEYVVTAEGPAGERTYRARHVVVAVPAPLVPDLVSAIPVASSRPFDRPKPRAARP